MNFTSVLPSLRRVAAVAAGAFSLLAPSAWADTISPTSFSATLGLGESVTIRKTVTVTAAPPTSALIDIMFVIDTTGSMGTAIANAKASATSLLNNLNATYGGGLFSGAGFYNDPAAAITAPLSASIAATQAAINALGASGGGDYPERGYDGIGLAAGSAWRPGSNRFIVALGDAGFNNGAFNQASTQAALTASGATLIGIDFCASAGTCSLAPTFASSITGLGGSVFAGGTSAATLEAAITSAISTSFATYSTVTVDDLGGGLPEIDVSTVCITADTGSCVGANAVGSYDRSVDRTFTYDVTFTRLADGPSAFDTFALVNGGIVAREADAFDVPEPGSLALVAISLLGLGVSRRKQQAAA